MDIVNGQNVYLLSFADGTNLLVTGMSVNNVLDISNEILEKIRMVCYESTCLKAG